LLLRPGRQDKDQPHRQNEKSQRFAKSHGHLARRAWTLRNTDSNPNGGNCHVYRRFPRAFGSPLYMKVREAPWTAAVWRRLEIWPRAKAASSRHGPTELVSGVPCHGDDWSPSRASLAAHFLRVGNSGWEV